MLLIELLQKQKDALEADPEHFRKMMPVFGDLMPFVADGGEKMFDCPVFEVSNVFECLSDTWASLYETPQGHDIRLATDVFPPHERFWMEWRIPDSTAPANQGAQAGQMWATRRSGSGWEATVISFAGPADIHLAMPVETQIHLEVDGNGRITSLTVAEPAPSIGGETQREELEAALNMLFCSVTALSFLNMHKKSVTVQTHTPSRQVRHQAQRKGQRVPPAFKTILVRGMGPSRPHGQKRPSGDNPFSLHIVRGHMIRAMVGKPLFGKPWGVGTFWVPSFMRGDIKNGDLRKVPTKVKLSEELKKKGEAA